MQLKNTAIATADNFHILTSALNNRFLYNKQNSLDLSIIIVNYNVKYFLEQCLCSVLNACKHINAEIFVVDNNSSDGSKEYLSPKFPQVNFKWNKDNVGFGKANNSVLSEAKGEHILFLNPDTIVAEDCFEKCLLFFKQHQNCGALGVRMIDGSGRFLKESKRSFPSAMASLFKVSGFAKLFPSSKMFAAYYAGHLPEHKNNIVDVLAGAYMMLSKAMITATNGFDEDFFMYAEDIDLSYRIQKEGKKNYYFADTTIIHFKGESTQRLSASYVHHFYNAMQLFVAKHYKDRQALYFLTSSAIAANKLLATVKMRIQQKLSADKKEVKQLTTAIIASQDYFNEMIHLIKYAVKPIIIVGRIGVDLNDTKESLGNISNIKQIISANKVEQILFCEAAINNKKTIELMQELSPKISFLFHAISSDSIVGSSNKNGNGVFIAKPFPKVPERTLL